MLHLLNDYLSLNNNNFDKSLYLIFGRPYDEILPRVNYKFKIYININDLDLLEENKDLIKTMSHNNKDLEKVDFITLLKVTKKHLNDLTQYSFKLYLDIIKESNNISSTEKVKNLSNIIFQYYKFVNKFIATIRNYLYNNTKNKRYNIISFMKDTMSKLNNNVIEDISTIKKYKNQIKGLSLKEQSDKIQEILDNTDNLLCDINNELNNCKYITDINYLLETIDLYNTKLSGAHNKFSRAYPPNKISNNDLYNLIKNFINQNNNIIQYINYMLLAFTENIMKQMFKEEYNKNLSNLNETKSLNNNVLTINNNNVSIIEYCDREHNNSYDDFKIYLMQNVLNGLSGFNHFNPNSKYTEEKEDIGSIYYYNKTLRKVINNLLNIKQNYKINGDNIKKEYVEEYTQILNECAKNISQMCEKCKPLINNIGNKAKELLKMNETLLNKQSQDNAKNNKIIHNNDEYYNHYDRLNNITYNNIYCNNYNKGMNPNTSYVHAYIQSCTLELEIENKIEQGTDWVSHKIYDEELL